MQKNKKDNILKRWYKLCEPHKGYWATMIITYMLYAGFLAVVTIFAAKTINCMYEKDWTGAFTYLGIELFCVLARLLAMHIETVYYGKMYGYVRRNVTLKVYKKLMSCDNASIKDMSQEKIINIATNNLAYLAEFPDVVAAFIGYSVQVIIALVTVFTSNLLAGLLVTAIGVMNFVAFYLFNRKLGKIMVERFEKKDDLFKSYRKVIDGKAVITEFSKEEIYKSQITRDVDNFGKAYEKYYKVHSYKGNIWKMFWMTIVYGIAALMLFYVSKSVMEMTTYMIIVPYLTSCSEKLITLFDKTSNLENMRVDVDRIENILALSDRQLATYGEFNGEIGGYNLSLIDVDTSEKLENGVSIKGLDMSFKIEGLNIIRGDREGGKRLIFNLLRRTSRPANGKILLDNLDLYDYNEKTFKHHINFCSSHPPFISGTIKENLSLAEKRFDKIRGVCEKVGILHDIENLPNGFNTQVIDVTSSELLFMLGMVRALLSNCKILMVYELPQAVSEEFKQRFIGVLERIKLERTVIFFTHDECFDAFGDLVYTVNAGNVEFLQKDGVKSISDAKNELDEIHFIAKKKLSKR